MKYSNRIYDVPTDTDEEVINVQSTNDLYNSYGYFIITFDSGKKMAIDYKGNAIVEKGNYTSLHINNTNNRLIDNTGFGGEKNKLNLYSGEKKFYDFVELETADGDSTEIYEINATFEKGLVTEFTRTKLSSAAAMDYSPIIENNTFTSRLKKYDFYITNDSAYVKDLNGKLVSSFAINKPTKYYVLDDTLFYQTTKTVTINDDYTYKNGNYFYALKTYTVDLLTGKTTELKNYKYLLSNTKSVKGYNEKDDRTYTAGIYAKLTKIENKKLDLENTTAMVDKKGKILSSKLGEKGSTLRYFDDKTYVLYDESYTSFISNNGSVKATYISDSVEYINFYNKQIFISDDNGLGYFVDSNLKIAGEPTAIPYEIVHTFKNGNILLRHYNELFLASINNGEINVIEKYDDFKEDIQLYPDLINDSVKRVIVNNSLNFYNIYLVTYENNDKFTVEIHSVDGTLLKTVNDAIDVYYNGDSVFEFGIETADEVYNFGVNYINAKTYDNGYN